jgi:hypothetical protein
MEKLQVAGQHLLATFFELRTVSRDAPLSELSPGYNFAFKVFDGVGGPRPQTRGMNVAADHPLVTDWIGTTKEECPNARDIGRAGWRPEG